MTVFRRAEAIRRSDRTSGTVLDEILLAGSEVEILRQR